MKRTTMALDERIWARVKQKAAQEGKDFQECANELLRLALDQSDRGTAQPVPLPSFAMGLALVDLADRDALEDRMEAA